MEEDLNLSILMPAVHVSSDEISSGDDDNSEDGEGYSFTVVD